MKKYIIILPLLFFACGLHAQMKTESIFVYFKTNKSDLGKIGKQKLDSVCKVFVDLKITDIDIYGHTDTRGDDKLNNDLSERRVKTVVGYIKSKGVDAKYIEQKKGFGKKSPKYDNNTVMGRRLNRRVEISYKYEDKNSKKTAEVEIVKAIVEPPRAKDTVIVSPKGTVIMMKDCAFAPIDYKDVKFEFNEYYDQESIQASGIRTITADGNCLESGGMAFIKAFYKGKEIQPSCPIEIAYPAKSIDRDLQLYDADSNVPPISTTWSLNNNTPLEFDSTGITARKFPIKNTPATYYYRYSTTYLGGKSCNKLQGKYMVSEKHILKFEKATFKIPKSDKNGLSILIQGGMHNIQSQRLATNKFYFPAKCLDIDKVTAIYYKDGVKMTCTKTLKELKYVKWRKMYKFKKKWFVPAK